MRKAGFLRFDLRIGYGSEPPKKVKRNTKPQHSPDGNGILFCFGLGLGALGNKKDTVDSR